MNCASADDLWLAEGGFLKVRWWIISPFPRQTSSRHVATTMSPPVLRLTNHWATAMRPAGRASDRMPYRCPLSSIASPPCGLQPRREGRAPRPTHTLTTHRWGPTRACVRYLTQST